MTVMFGKRMAPKSIWMVDGGEIGGFGGMQWLGAQCAGLFLEVPSFSCRAARRALRRRRNKAMALYFFDYAGNVVPLLRRVGEAVRAHLNRYRVSKLKISSITISLYTTIY